MPSACSSSLWATPSVSWSTCRAARTGDELAVLSRNCQLAPGERALLQRHRQIDVIPDAVRAQHKRNNADAAADLAQLRRSQEDAMRVLEASTPEL